MQWLPFGHLKILLLFGIFFSHCPWISCPCQNSSPYNDTIFPYTTMTIPIFSHISYFPTLEILLPRYFIKIPICILFLSVPMLTVSASRAMVGVLNGSDECDKNSSIQPNLNSPSKIAPNNQETFPFLMLLGITPPCTCIRQSRVAVVNSCYSGGCGGGCDFVSGGIESGVVNDWGLQQAETTSRSGLELYFFVILFWFSPWIHGRERECEVHVALVSFLLLQCQHGSHMWLTRREQILVSFLFLIF